MISASGIFILGALVYPLRTIVGGLDGAFIGSFPAFELPQKPEVLSGLQGYLPGTIINYAKHGIYDPLDIAAGFFGIAVAVATVLTLIGKRDI